MSKHGVRPSETSITKFIRSNRVFLPPNIGKHVRGASLEDFCPFCLAEHNNNTIFYRKKISEPLSILLNTYSCDMCNEEIEKKSSDKNMEDMFEEFSVRAGVKAIQRIDGVVHEASFPNDTHKFYNHLNPDKEPFRITPDCCLFCQVHLGAAKNEQIDPQKKLFVEYFIPVGMEMYHLDGGQVKHSRSCDLVMTSKLSDTYIAHLLTFSGIDICKRCGDQYFVNNSEVDSRNASQTFGKHMCPECCYNNLQSDDKLMYEGENLMVPYSNIVRDEFHKIQRFVDVNCSYCSSPVAIDLTMHPEEVINKHTETNLKFICDDCVFRETAPINVLVKDDIITRIFNINDKFYIKRVTTKGKFLNFDTSLNAEEVLKFLLAEENEQLTLY